MDAIAVELGGQNIGQVAVPHLIGVLGQRDPLEFTPAVLVEQT